MSALSAETVAVVVAVTAGTPRVLTLRAAPRLPSGPFTGARSLQSGVREWIARQTGHVPGYLEQLYTFADSDRLRPSAGDDAGLGRVISVTYLGLARQAEGGVEDAAAWRDWYAFFPWEDRRRGSAAATAAAEALRGWADRAGDAEEQRRRRRRVELLWGERWNEDLALSRYELLHEAGLVAETARRSGGLGVAMVGDHRRILATAVARLRAKIKYRALVFELMPELFTMLELQQTIEAISGRGLHKGNFRRMIAAQDLVEETGALAAPGRGRPAQLFRFRGSAIEERALSTTRLPLVRT